MLGLKLNHVSKRGPCIQEGRMWEIEHFQERHFYIEQIVIYVSVLILNVAE